MKGIALVVALCACGHGSPAAPPPPPKDARPADVAAVELPWLPDCRNAVGDDRDIGEPRRRPVAVDDRATAQHDVEHVTTL